MRKRKRFFKLTPSGCSIFDDQAGERGDRLNGAMLVVNACGCVIAMVAFGPRSSLGFFLTPMSSANGWGREVFAFAVAIQNLLWGVGQPFAGAVADRFGTNRVLIAGSLFYAAGLALMATSTSPGMMTLSAGVLIGFGLSGCSFNIVLGAIGKLLPESPRLLAFV